MFQLKYRNDQTAIEPLVDTASSFLRNASNIDAIVPVPPSVARKDQPVLAVAAALAERLNIPLCTTCLSKVRKTPQLKDIVDYDERQEILKGAFAVSKQNTRGKRLLLFDDLYGSGATVRAITELLKKQGHAQAVYLLTLTRKL